MILDLSMLHLGKIIYFIFFSSLFTYGTTSDQDQNSLKELFKSKFKIGVALNKNQIRQKKQKENALIKKEFSSLTAENIMKWEEIHPKKDKYNFKISDLLVKLSEENNQDLIGHTLVWHNQIPDWVTRKGDGSLVSDNTLYRNIFDHISSVAGRYSGKIKGWDVVNEAILDDGSYRENDFYKISADEYIFKSFENLFGPRSISFLEVSDYKKSNNNSHLQASKSFLNPNSYNLSRLTKDLYLLADGKSIWQNINNSRRKIDSYDFIFINGIHSLTVKRLRQRLDLKIFFEVDQDLNDYFFKKNKKNSILSFKSKSEKKEFNNYQDSQFKYSDLSFKVSPVNSNLLKSKEEIVIPKLKLFVKMANGFFHEELIRSLISLCGMFVDVEQTSFSDDVYLCIEGEATKEDIAQIANILIPNLEDLLICNPLWDNGYRGLIQLIILVHISNLLYRSSSSKNYV